MDLLCTPSASRVLPEILTCAQVCCGFRDLPFSWLRGARDDFWRPLGLRAASSVTSFAAPGLLERPSV